MSSTVIGIDMGTTAVKVMVFDLTGKKLSGSYVEYPISSPHPGWAEQDAQLLWECLLQGMDIALQQLTVEQRAGVKALSLSTQRSTMVPVDEDGTPLRPAITWMDSRSSAQCLRLEQDLGRQQVFCSTGNSISPIWTGSYLLWLRQNEPQVFERAACFANIHSFIMKKLGCEGFYLDYSNAGETMMFDSATRRWSQVMLRYIGVEQERLPALVESGVELGTLSAELCKRFSLPHCVKLISGGGDQQCAALGCGVCDEGDFSVGMGTAANILALSGKFRLDEKGILTSNCAAMKEKWFLEGSLIACGPILNWLKSLAYSRQETFADLDAEVACSKPGANGVLMLPHFAGAGAPYWNDKATGVFSGVTLSTTRADLARAIMEGLSLEVCKSLQLIRGSGIRPKRIFLTGGASKSDVWCQIQSDIYQTPVLIPQSPDVAAIGAVILAIQGSGMIPSVEDAIALYAKTQRTYLPQGENAALYRELRESSEELYQRLYR